MDKSYSKANQQDPVFNSLTSCHNLNLKLFQFEYLSRCVKLLHIYRYSICALLTVFQYYNYSPILVSLKPYEAWSGLQDHTDRVTSLYTGQTGQTCNVSERDSLQNKCSARTTTDSVLETSALSILPKAVWQSTTGKTNFIDPFINSIKKYNHAKNNLKDSIDAGFAFMDHQQMQSGSKVNTNFISLRADPNRPPITCKVYPVLKTFWLLCMHVVGVTM